MRLTAAHMFRLIIASCLVFLAGCANIDYADDFKDGTDFSDLTRYSWRSVSADLAGADPVRLERLADRQLAQQGLLKSAHDSQLLIDLQVFSQAAKSGNSSIGIGIGMPVGRNGSIGLGTSQLLNRAKQEGVILVDITRASDNTLIWRGSAEGIPLSQFSLSAEDKLSATLSQLLKQFPPQTKTN